MAATIRRGVDCCLGFRVEGFKARWNSLDINIADIDPVLDMVFNRPQASVMLATLRTCLVWFGGLVSGVWFWGFGLGFWCGLGV